MQALSKAAAGKSYTIKWMFGIPEVLDKIRKCKIDEGSEITVIQNSGRDLIIRSGEKRIAMSSDAQQEFRYKIPVDYFLQSE